jgi:hypothetical protein
MRMWGYTTIVMHSGGFRRCKIVKIAWIGVLREATLVALFIACESLGVATRVKSSQGRDTADKGRRASSGRAAGPVYAGVRELLCTVRVNSREATAGVCA